MLSLIQDEVVVQNKWMTPQEFTDLIAISQMTPGPIGINTATYAGYSALERSGYSPLLAICGAVIATIALCLPSFLMISVISCFFTKFRTNSYFAAVMTVLRPLSISLIAIAALSLMNRENFIDAVSPVLFLGALVLSLAYKVHPVLIIFLAGIIGLIIY